MSTPEEMSTPEKAADGVLPTTNKHESSWKKYETYYCEVDPKQGDRATEIKLLSFKRPHMRGFHFAWFGFFMAFSSWFAFAPLMPQIKKDLGLTKDELYNANIASVASTVLMRFAVGPLCDRFGTRTMFSMLLTFGAIPVFFGGLVNNGIGLVIIRFVIGVLGATFVPCQAWCSQLFAKEIVGTANAMAGGWGNLGGGAVQLLMVGVWNMFRTGFDDEEAWRLSFIVPGVLTCGTGICMYFFSDDSPKGNFKELEQRGTMERKSSKKSFQEGFCQYNAWILFIQYAACFGVEVTMNNILAVYLETKYELSVSLAGLIASLFGLMNLFARAMGGALSDKLFQWFGAGTTGMRGRIYAQSISLVWEGIMLLIFTRMDSLGATIGVLLLFSLGVQMAEGCTFGIVPYVKPTATGAVSGVVGAGGNVGAVCWGLMFRFGPSEADDVLFILGFIVIASAVMGLFVLIQGHDGCITKAKGEPESLDVI